MIPPPVPSSNANPTEAGNVPAWAAPCPDCSAHISSGAESCPRCGSAELHARRKAGPCETCKGPLYFAGREMRGHFDGGGVFTALLGIGLIVWGWNSMLIVGADLIGLGSVSIGIGGLGLTVARVARYEVLWFTCRPCKANKSVNR